MIDLVTSLYLYISFIAVYSCELVGKDTHDTCISVFACAFLANQLTKRPLRSRNMLWCITRDMGNIGDCLCVVIEI